MTVITYTLLSVAFVSLLSLVGILTLSVKQTLLKKWLFLMVAFSAGAMLGDSFLHLLPEAVEEKGFGLTVSLGILAGIIVMFIVEKVIHWHHCHGTHEVKHEHEAFATMSLVGDSVHNIIDGMIIAGSYLVSIPIGIATTIAVILHELPQEISDFGILLHGGYSKKKALLMNFVVSLFAVAGALLVLFLSDKSATLTEWIVPFAAGGFIYIAAADLIPELHKEVRIKKTLTQLAMFLLGIGVMYALLFLE
jgi:zinc and cadmium transporter